MELKGAVALVTGGNGGLGQRICHALAQEGAHVAIMYARSREQAEGVAGELASRYHIKSQAFACDITDGAAVNRLVGEVTQAFGRLDILVNDAAYNFAIPFANLDDLTRQAAWRESDQRFGHLAAERATSEAADQHRDLQRHRRSPSLIGLEVGARSAVANLVAPGA